LAYIRIDFETKSRVDITKHGAAKYFADPKADIIFLSFKIDDRLTEQWHPGEELPQFIKYPDPHKFYAFNALFEYRAWNILGTKKHEYQPIKLNQLIDVQALCARFTYPFSLERAGEVLELVTQKDKRGKFLIKKICTPPFNYTHSEFFEFMQYGKDDVNTMHEMIDALPATKLSAKEQKIWELTQKINLRGLPVDIKAVKQIYKVTEAYKEDQNTLLPELTNGNVTKATQTQRITRWLRRKGVTTPNLQAKTVISLLERLDLPEDCRLVLQLRQDLGKSSTAKYLKIMHQEHNGRIYDNLRYCGAEKTGRWGGMGFQIHNLPRSKVKDAQPIIDRFYDLTIIEDNPVAAAKDIVRGMICARDGYLIVAADYSSIENRGLAWIAGDEYTLNLFRKGLDQYIDMAVSIFNVAYADIDDGQRQFGKMLILGCGYGLGGKGFQTNAADWGVYLDLEESESLVKIYRERYALVVRLWYRCRRAALNAISHPGIEFPVNDKVAYKLILDRNRTPWLRCMLPSGRALYYNKPEIRDGKYGDEVTAMGINPYSKKWQRLSVIPGRLVENIVQATCRDLLAEHKLIMDKQGFNLVGSIHDEAIAEEHESIAHGRLDEMCQIMSTPLPWTGNLPLGAEGMAEKRYRKM
jgi:DNA polymerase